MDRSLIGGANQVKIYAEHMFSFQLYRQRRYQIFLCRYFVFWNIFSHNFIWRRHGTQVVPSIKVDQNETFGKKVCKLVIFQCLCCVMRDIHKNYFKQLHYGYNVLTICFLQTWQVSWALCNINRGWNLNIQLAPTNNKTHSN